MSWSNKLLETYDICQSEVGKESETGMLLPLSHLTTKAQIEVVLDENGKPKLQYTDKDGNVTIGDYDLVPILDKFVEEHLYKKFH